MNNQDKQREVPQERVTVYSPQSEYRRLKAKLAMQGLSVTEWFRRKLREEINSS